MSTQFASSHFVVGTTVPLFHIEVRFEPKAVATLPLRDEQSVPDDLRFLATRLWLLGSMLLKAETSWMNPRFEFS